MSIDDLLIKGKSSCKRDIVVECCSCKHFLNNEGEYIKLSDDDRLKVYEDYLISHGYCMPCINKIYPNYKSKMTELEENENEQ